VDQLRGFWRDYSATGLIDTLLNDSAQMAFRFRSMVALPGLSPDDVSSLNHEPLRRALERRVNFAECRSRAADEDVPGLVVGAVDVDGATEALYGPQITADRVIDLVTMPHPFAAGDYDGGIRKGRRLLHLPPIRELTDFGPDEIWVIQVLRSTRDGSPRTTSELSDHDELTGRILLEQELRFIQTINGLLDRGVLIAGGYRHIEVHRIIMEHDLDHSSKLDRSSGFIGELVARGSERAKQFLDKRRCRLSGRARACAIR
jgi:NTE family protein